MLGLWDAFTTYANEWYIIITVIVLGYLWSLRDGYDGDLMLVYAAIVGWSGFVYLNFIGLQWAPVSLNEVYYLDWIVSTPLLALAISMTVTGRVTAEARRAALAQVGVIAFGWMAFRQETGDIAPFAISAVLLIYVLWQLWQIPGMKRNADLFAIYAVTWVTYPILWWIAGGDLIAIQEWMVLVPLVSKHGAVLFDLHRSKARTVAVGVGI